MDRDFARATTLSRMITGGDVSKRVTAIVSKRVIYKLEGENLHLLSSVLI